jgi:hypothetical protein
MNNDDLLILLDKLARYAEDNINIAPTLAERDIQSGQAMALRLVRHILTVGPERALRDYHINLEGKRR